MNVFGIVLLIGIAIFFGVEVFMFVRKIIEIRRANKKKINTDEKGEQ